LFIKTEKKLQSKNTIITDDLLYGGGDLHGGHQARLRPRIKQAEALGNRHGTGRKKKTSLEKRRDGN